MSTRLLSDWIDSYFKAVKSSDSPDSFKLWSAIGTIAACLKRKCYLEWGTEVFYPNLYIVLVGPSGCRKSSAMKPGQRLLRDISVRLSSEAITRAALVRELSQASDTHIYPDGRIYPHASLTIYSKELTVFLGYKDLQLMSDLTDWYDCDDHWTNKTKTCGQEEISGIWVNIIGATTPSLIQTALPMDAIGGGLTSRIIFIYEHRRGSDNPFPFPTEEEEALMPALKHDLELIHMLSGRFRFSKRFLDSYLNWFNEKYLHPPFTDERFGGYNERRANHLLKLCMIFNASRTDKMFIEDIDLARADLVLTAAEQKMHMVFRGVGKSQIASLIPRILLILIEKGSVSYAELLTRVSDDADEFTLNKAIKALETMGQLTITSEGRRTFIEITEAGKAMLG